MNKANNIPAKINLSSTQVLKTLRVLIQGDYTMSELIEKLNKNEEKPIFNNSVVCKYINTCRFCGIEIHRVCGKYIVSSIPFCLNITDRENILLDYLKNKAGEALSSQSNKEFNNFLKKLSKYAGKELATTEKGDVNTICEAFEDAIRCKHKVLLILKDKTKAECTPINIEEDNGKLYFHVTCQDRERMIYVKRVSAIQIMTDRFVPMKNEGSSVFELTGNLAKNYSLREYETIIQNNLPESLTIRNHGENNVVLVSRLMRYGELCKLKNPSHLCQEMRRTIDETLANYGEV